MVNNVQANNIIGKKSAAIFMDINKAFDSIWHKGILFKLNKLNCPKYLICIIQQYLQGRTMMIRINQTLSEEFTPEQGVPQGSPLAPLLYNLYCYDIYSPNSEYFDPNNYILQYADDTTIVAHADNMEIAIRSLQESTDNAIHWFNKWRLRPNPTKSRLMLFNHKLSPTSPSLNVNGIAVHPQQYVKYLGIHLDPKLNFKKHGEVVKQQAVARAQHFRSFTYKTHGINLKTAVHIYKMLCRPIIEYGLMLLENARNPARKKIEVAETSCLRKITKIRHPRNPLHNPPNIVLYEKTGIEPILQRIKRLQQKFIANTVNADILNPIATPISQDTTRRRQYPIAPLKQALFL